MKKFMEETVMNEMTFLEVSDCGNKQAEKKLGFIGSTDARTEELFKKMMSQRQWDIISVRDIPWHTLKNLEMDLDAKGYRMYIHKSWKNVKQKWRYTCLSALFVKENVAFEQIYTDDQFDTTLRYVAGKIHFAGKEILYKTNHIPCVDVNRPNLSHQTQRKIAMLEDEVQFQLKNQSSLAISAGDFNGDLVNGEWYGQEQYERFVFRDTVTENTYEDKRLDHVFISNAFENSDITVKTEVLADYYMQYTDHKIIAITLKAS
jgi:hypothetical protein